MGEEKARPWVTLEQPVCADCLPGRRTLLQVRGYVSKCWGGIVSPGCDPGPRERKAQEVPTLPQQFFPDAREPSPKALLGSSSEGLFAPSGKISAKAQPSLGSKSCTLGGCCLPELSTLQCGVRNQPRTKTSFPRHPVCPRKKRVGTYGNSLKERVKPVTAAPFANPGRVAHTAPGAQGSSGHGSRETDVK